MNKMLAVLLVASAAVLTFAAIQYRHQPAARPSETAPDNSDDTPPVVDDDTFYTINGTFDGIYNVAHSATAVVGHAGDLTSMAYVVWYDQDEWKKSSKAICDFDASIKLVDGTTLDAYLKAHGDVLEAAMHQQTSEYFCPQKDEPQDEQPDRH